MEISLEKDVDSLLLILGNPIEPMLKPLPPLYIHHLLPQ